MFTIDFGIVDFLVELEKLVLLVVRLKSLRMKVDSNIIVLRKKTVITIDFML